MAVWHDFLPDTGNFHTGEIWIMDVKEKLIPYEEYRLTFDHVIHTEDGYDIQIGFPMRCKICFMEDYDKEHKAFEICKLFDRMRDEVMRDFDICI